MSCPEGMAMPQTHDNGGDTIKQNKENLPGNNHKPKTINHKLIQHLHRLPDQITIVINLQRISSL